MSILFLVSTPKSCRQKMYNTPCPPESPVSSAINQPNFDNVCDVAGTEGEQIPYYGVQVHTFIIIIYFIR